jgi:hypothetical protein
MGLGVVPNSALVNALRDLGFEFKRQADRVMIYKKVGNTTRVAVRRIDMHDDEAAKIVLKQAGMDATAIEKFIQAYKQ